MPRMTKHIAATAGLVAALGGFGVGAYALAQGGASFDPSAFMAAYSNGTVDKTKGYQANPSDSDAEANRKDDGDKDQGSGTDDTAENQTPTASDLPVQGASSTTAVRMTGEGLGTAAVAGGSGNGSAAGSGTGNVITGPVIPGSNAGGNGTGGNGSNNGSGDNTGGNGNSGSQTTPTENSYKVLPFDPTPDEKGLDSTVDEKPVNGSNSEIADLNVNDPNMKVVIMAGNALGLGNEGTELYIGQRLDAWTVFCSLYAKFSYTVNDEPHVSAWSCTKEEFSSYDYFKVTDYPEVVPDSAFELRGQYRINDKDSWHDWSVTYTPEQSCVLVVSGVADADGNQTVLTKVVGNSVDLNKQIEHALNARGYGNLYQEIDHLLLGWKEGSTDIDLNAIYTPEPGRHVIEPGKFVKVPSGCTAELTGKYVDGTGFFEFQTLVDVEDDSEAVHKSKNGKRTLRLPEGFQKIALETDECKEFDYLELPNSMLMVEGLGESLRVNKAFKVNDDNAVYGTTADGVLTNKAGTEYYGVPASLSTLVVPEGVTSVNLPQNEKLKKVVIEATDAAALPAFDLTDIKNCTFTVDESVANAFVSAYISAFSSKTGNAVVISSYPDMEISGNRGVLMAGGDVVLVADTGSSWAFMDPPMTRETITLKDGCFSGNTGVDTLVLNGSNAYRLDDGCLEDSNIKTIVCENADVADYVRSRLEAAGVPDAEVAVIQTSKDDYRYYTTSTETVLLEAPTDVTGFYGTMTAEDGSAIEPTSIAAWAFEGCDKLTWAMTSEATVGIGEEAFAGCKSLQGLFIGRTEEIGTELRAFANCPSMRFVASRAMKGYVDIASDDYTMGSDEIPNSSCVMYAPTGALGYNQNFTSFTESSGVADYTVVKEDDGSLLLCGDNDSGDPWLILAGAASYNRKVKLPATTLEIYSGSFTGVGGSFTINWDELTSLQWVDWSAFKDSGISGDLLLGTSDAWIMSVGDLAFSGCAGITSVTSDASLFNVGSGAFTDCTALKKVKTATVNGQYFGAYINAGSFYGCSSLNEVEFTMSSPATLTIYGPGSPFVFDGSVSPDDDASRIKLTVPEGSEESYINQWTYLFAGYSDYDECYKTIYNDLLYNGRAAANQAGRVPTDAEVKAEMSQQLLDAENRLRKMMGMPLVDKSSIFSSEVSGNCTFDTVDGEVRLAAVDRDATEIDLTKDVPEGVDSFIIPADVFAKCTKLKRIVLTDKVSEIQTGAFNGCDGVTVVLPAVDEGRESTPIELTGGDSWTPYDFGGSIKLEVPEGSAEKYLKVWPQQMYGCNDWTMTSHVSETYWVLSDSHDASEITGDMLNYSVNEPFVERENLLRDMMGLPQVEDYKDACSFYDASWYVDVWGGGDSGDSGDIWGDDLTEDPDAPGSGDSNGGSFGDSAGAGSGDSEMKPDGNLNADGEQVSADAPSV